MFYFDLTYFVYVLPAIALTIWAQARVSRAYSAGKSVAASSGAAGADAAALILQTEGVDDVAIERVDGMLTDHYDSINKVLRLSTDVYSGRSLAALGVAAHEAGHAIQHARRYVPLVARNLIVPIAGIGSNASWLVMTAGLLLHSMHLITIGVLLFSTIVVFQVINLPVELDASRRARVALASTGLIAPREDEVVASVLNAAAWTYVAATLSSLTTLIYYLVRFGLFGGRDQR